MTRKSRPETTPDDEPGRNDPCWCGSGKKYKKCCLRQRKEREPDPSISPELERRVRPLGREFLHIDDEYTARTGRARNSDVLERFAEPMFEGLDPDPGFNILHNGYMLAMIVWNALVTGTDEDREIVLDTFRKGMSAEVALEQWEMLRARKQGLFPHDDRIFLDMELTMLPTGPYLQVAARLPD